MNYQDQTVLLNALRKGEEKAFICLIDQYNHRLFTYAITLTNNQTMASGYFTKCLFKNLGRQKKN